MKSLVRASLLLAALLGAAAGASAEGLQGVYRYNFSNFGGHLPLMGVRLHVDAIRDEAYVLESSVLRVFNRSGMEIHSVTLDTADANFYDVGVNPAGDIFLLAVPQDRKAGWYLQQCDFRGTPKARVTPRGLPERLANFGPNHMAVTRDGFVLVSAAQLLAVYLAPNGGFEKAIDLIPALELPANAAGTVQLGGFAVAPDGSLLFTVPERFQATVVAPDGTHRIFGTPGSREGQFGIVAGIAADAQGRIYVADKLRSRVMVFDGKLEFLGEFGGYGDDPGDLVVPDSVAVSPSGFVYVTQMRRRGISVFEITSD